jgi:hypothetical protein
MKLGWHGVFFCTALAAFSASAFALDWKSQTQAVTTAPFQKEISITFEFSNRASKSVTIREIETSCSCVRADSDRKIYPPGTSGVITAQFTLGDRGGLYERSVTVVTDENDDLVRLMLKIEVPDVATATPRSVDWKLGEDAAEKTVELKSLENLDILFSTAQSTSDDFSTRLEIVTPGRLYRLHLKPKATDHLGSAAIRIYGREKMGHDVLLSAYASVH